MPPKSGSAAGQFPTLPELKKTGWIGLVVFVSAGGTAMAQYLMGEDFGPLVNSVVTIGGATAIDLLSRWLTDTRGK